MKIRVNDEVLIIAGKDKGRRGRVVAIDKARNRVVVEGINVVVRHLKRNPQNPETGGRVHRPASIAASNVMVWSPDDGRASRVRYEGSGPAKKRVATRSGASLTAAGKKAPRPAREGRAKDK